MSRLDYLKKAVRTPRFWLAILLGQFLALCISTTNITTGLMASEPYKINIPTFQSFVNYILLCVVYTTFTIYKLGFKQFFHVLKVRGWKYFLLALADVEGNYFVVKGFGNTNYLSAMLINACSTPGVVLLSFLFLKTRYRWTHLSGVFLSVCGLVLLVVSDVLTEKNYDGDIYCIIGALFYSVSNTLEEFFVRQHPKWEIIGMLGFFGLIINGIQLAALERQELATVQWEPVTIGLYSGFTIAMFSLYSCVPVLISMTSATFYNISLLTSDFYGLILGLLFVPDIKAHELYPVAFVLVLIGLIIYNVYPTFSKFDRQEGIQSENPAHYDNDTGYCTGDIDHKLNP